RALAPDPALIVADEPTGNLDEATGHEIIELLFRGHRERGTTLVLVTLDTELAARCDRVLHLHSGRLAAPMLHEAKCARWPIRETCGARASDKGRKSRGALPGANCAAACADLASSSP